MRSIILFLAVFTALLSSVPSSYAQDTKQEKEVSIKLEDFPGEIPGSVHQIESDPKREKFYKQQDGDELSFEMKFRYKRYDHSIEVDTTGRLIDAEVEIKKNEIPRDLRERISNYLKKEFERTKIEKIQAQFIKPEQQVVDEFLEKVMKEPLKKPDHYEIIVAVKNDGDFKRFEFLFDTKGNVKKKRKVIRNEYDHLIF